VIKLIILDRDGTINVDREDYVKSAEEFEPLPGALDAIARLNHAGWHTVLATNQAGLGRGLFDMATLNAIHLKMNHLLAELGGRIDAVFFCPHTEHEGCACRKPAPGLFRQIGERYGVNLADALVVGDSRRDLVAGAAVGCATHLVRTGKAAAMSAEQIEALCAELPGTRVHADLAAFADDLIHREFISRGMAGESDSGYGRLA
jgi:D-glycero-D-manno-heptose 1,7-bisphosphate phosphatase